MRGPFGPHSNAVLWQEFVRKSNIIQRPRTRNDGFVAFLYFDKFRHGSPYNALFLYRTLWITAFPEKSYSGRKQAARAPPSKILAALQPKSDFWRRIKLLKNRSNYNFLKNFLTCSFGEHVKVYNSSQRAPEGGVNP